MTINLQEYPENLYYKNSDKDIYIWLSDTPGITKKCNKLELVKIVSKDDKDAGRIKALLELKNDFVNKRIKYESGQYVLVKRVDRSILAEEGWANWIKYAYFTNKCKDKAWFDKQDYFAIYKCVGEIINPNLASINKKRKETLAKNKEIIKNSKMIKDIHLGNKWIYLKRDFIEKLLEEETKSLGINLKNFSIDVMGE